MRVGVCFLLLPLCALFCHRFLTACWDRECRSAFWLKGGAGLCFVLTAALLLPWSGDGRYSPLILGGLLLGLLGDQLLALRFVWPDRHDQMFLTGTLSFAAGHVLYLLALSRRFPGALTAGLPFWAGLLLLSGLFLLWQRANAGKLQVPGLLYIALVCLMAASACGACLRSREPAALFFALGGLCFVFSDDLLSARCFGKVKKSLGTNRAIHISYYLAQLLIAWTLFV